MSRFWGGADLNYIGLWSCIRKSSAREIKVREGGDSATLVERKAEVGGQKRGRLERATRSGSWLTIMPHRLNSLELLWEEF